MSKEHDRIVLTSDVPGEGLKAGDVGTVVHIYNDGVAYEVEFVSLEGRSLAVATLNVPFTPARSPTRASCPPHEAESCPLPTAHCLLPTDY